MITLIERLKVIENRYNLLTEELSKEENIRDIKKLKELSKEHSSLEEAVELYHEYAKILNDTDEAKSLLHDKDMAEFAQEELVSLQSRQIEIEAKIEIVLLPKDPNDSKNIIMEIRGAAGGDEGNIFAGDLARMYSKYAEEQGWSFETLNSIEGTSGGFSLIEIMIKGNNVYSKLKYESGSHRVQRVPETESQGRIHTSTSTVLVMPEAEDVDIEVRDIDIKIDVYRSGGAGGQSVNTCDSAVRMTHLPTGIVVTCQNERSQLKNKEQAIKILKAKIYEDALRKEEESVTGERRSKIGNGDRSEKIRTYNYPQNRLTDHRIGFTSMNLDRIMEGKIGEVIEALIAEDQKRKMEAK